MGWKLIDEHRKKARQISFDILVWGPSAKDSIGYQLRSLVKEHLIKNGHSAKFSEELLTEGKIAPSPDPIVDEVFQADAADLIIALYGSRGTQTEIDVILEHENFARKSVIALNEGTWNNIMNSLSAEKWRGFRGKILWFLDDQYNHVNLCNALDDLMERLQFAEYYRRLKKSHL
jgi:hypothetical protein